MNLLVSVLDKYLYIYVYECINVMQRDVIWFVL